MTSTDDFDRDEPSRADYVYLGWRRTVSRQPSTPQDYEQLLREAFLFGLALAGGLKPRD